jgi:alpha-tubulin suppressor-like RCC1 family protein
MSVQVNGGTPTTNPVDHRIPRAALAVVAAVVLAFPARSEARGTTATSGLAASDHTCVITAEGRVKCWGGNSAGGLGDGTTIASTTPVDVAGLASGVSAIAAGDRYSCALTTGGGVKCWGYNEFGQLGDGTTTNSTTPVDVAGLTSGVSAIAARGEHTCALITDRVKCWGANFNGQLGDGTTTSSGVPVDVAGLTSAVIAIAAGGEHTCAVATGGGVKCWGWNGAGQLGIGTTTDSSIPVDVVGLASGVTAIAAGGRHTCALMTAGGVKCWGYDEFGQLGDGTTIDSAMPVDVAWLTSSVEAITSGGNFTCALRTAGMVTCWGIDLTGQLAGGATFDSAVPVDVVGLASGVTAIVAGYYHICAITREGRVTCWGGNDSGQLGNGTTIDSPTPIDLRNADGTLLIASSGDLQTPSLLPLAIAVVLGLVVIATAGWYAATRRRRP